MKKRLLIFTIASFGYLLSVNGKQNEPCMSEECKRKTVALKAHAEFKKPVWRSIEGQPNLIEIKEGDVWVQYKKSTSNCPPRHHNRQWKGHEHYHAHHRMSKDSHKRHVKYERNQNGDIIDGIMNVKEDDACWQYMRNSFASHDSKNDAAFITAIEESLEID